MDVALIRPSVLSCRLSALSLEQRHEESAPVPTGARSWKLGLAMGQIGALGRQLGDGVPNCILHRGSEALKSAARGERKAAPGKNRLCKVLL